MAVTRLSDLNREDIADQELISKGSFRVRPSGYRFPVGLLTKDEELDYLTNPDNTITTTNATKTDSSDYVIYSWTTSGTFEHTDSRNIIGDLLIVAGGGAGQSRRAESGGMSGGGAGGLLYYSDLPGLTGPPGPASANSKSPNGPAVSLSPSVNFTVTIGAGGLGGGHYLYPQGVGNPAASIVPGYDSSFANTSPYVPASQQVSLTATGGGTQPSADLTLGTPGGSGSGNYGGGPEPQGPYAGTGVPGQGNPGGDATNAMEYSGGGGGGAGGPGSPSVDENPRSGKDGNAAPTSQPYPNLPAGAPQSALYDNEKRYASGGDGLDFDISGTQRTYAAGGGGSGRGYAHYGGSDNLGGRGSGSSSGDGRHVWSPQGFGGNGTVNRGSGGGGGEHGGAGGSGVVIMKISKKTNPWQWRIN